MTSPRTGRPAPRTRRAARAAAVVLPLVLLGWLPAVASAAPADDLPGHTASFTIVDGILIFGVAPIGVFLLVALVVMRPGSAPRAQRYRPGREWNAAPSWSGLAPARTAGHDLAVAEHAMPVMDGAGAAEHDGSDDEAGRHAGGGPAETPRGETTGTGGASGSW